MRQPHVPDRDLRPDDVPGPDAPWSEIAAFGHRFHAYKVAGSLQRVAALTVEAHDAWQHDGSVPDELPRCRLALFHTVRATDGRQPDPATQEWARALVAAIRSRVRTADRDEPSR